MASCCSITAVVCDNEQLHLVLLLSGLVKVISYSWQLRASCSCKTSCQLTPIIFFLCSVHNAFDVVGTLKKKHPEKSRNTNKSIKLAKDSNWNSHTQPLYRKLPAQ